MTTVTTTPEATSTGLSVPRLLTLAMGALLVVDLVGGVWAALSGVNTWADAWGGHALLAAPAPMVAGQVLRTWMAVRGSRRRAAIPAGLLALACLVSVSSGFFDGGLGNAALEPGMAAYQVFLLAITGVVGVLGAVRAVQLVRG
jgi:hypothetical protein